MLSPIDGLVAAGFPFTAELQLAGRAILIYVSGVLIVRVGKSRLLSRATPLDVLLAFMLGSLFSRGISGSTTIEETLIAAITLVTAHFILSSISAGRSWWGWLVKGNAITLVQNGEIDWKCMRHSHISEHDLREEMRLNANIDDIRKVKLAVKERSGQISVVRMEPAVHQVETTVENGVQTIRIIIANES